MNKIFFLQLHTFVMHTCFNSIHIKLFVGKSMKNAACIIKCMGFYGNHTSKCLGTVAVLVLYRGSGQEVGRSCHILEFKGKKVMVCTV